MIAIYNFSKTDLSNVVKNQQKLSQFTPKIKFQRFKLADTQNLQRNEHIYLNLSQSLKKTKNVI